MLTHSSESTVVYSSFIRYFRVPTNSIRVADGMEIYTELSMYDFSDCLLLGPHGARPYLQCVEDSICDQKPRVHRVRVSPLGEQQKSRKKKFRRTEKSAAYIQQ